jgi:hypothetical protein
VTHFPDRQSSEEIAATRRLTLRDVASAWSMVLLGLVGLVVVSLADLAALPDRTGIAVDPATAVNGHDPSFCRRAATDISG